MCIYHQLIYHFIIFFKKNKLSFQREYSEQQCLVALIELLKKVVDNKSVFEVFDALLKSNLS